MLNFTIKNLLVRKSKIILICIAIIIATTVGLVAINISNQVSDGIINTTGYYDTIVGPQGSQTSLALSSMFFSENPLGTLEYSYYENLKNDKRVNAAIPMAMGDSYKSHKLIGTFAEFIEDKKLKDGELFTEEFQAVLGYNVAKNNNLKVGDTFISSHGISEQEGHDHATNPYTVVGVLNKTNTSYDNNIFVHIESVWEAHADTDHEHEEEEHDHEEEKHTDVGAGLVPAQSDDHDHEHEENMGVTAIIIRAKSMQDQVSIANEYNQIAGVQAINPATVIRGVLNNIDLTKQIVYILSFIIFIMAILIIYIITILNIYDTRKDIYLMRLLGISQKKIFTIFIIQNAIVTVVSVLVSMVLSKIMLMAVSGFTAGMGIVLNVAKVYSIEYLMLLAVFIICLIPTVILNLKLFKKDPISD